jgi:hypothetical protein
MGRFKATPSGVVRVMGCAAMCSLGAASAVASHVGEELMLDQQAVESSTQLLAVLKLYESTPANQRSALAAQLTQVALQRKQHMLALIDVSPNMAALRVLPASVRMRLPAQAQALVEQPVQVKGSVAAMIGDDFQRGRAQTKLQIADDKGGQFELRVASNNPREQSTWSGRRGTVNALQLDRHLLVVDKRQLQLLAADGGITSSTNVAVAASAVQGVQNTLVVMLNFNDRAIECTPSDLQSRLFGSAGATLDQGYRQSSGGLVSFTGNVIGPFNTAYSSTGACDHNGWANAGKAAAQAAGINLAAYQRISYVTPRNTNCGWTGLGSLGGTPPTPTWVQQCTSTGMFSHELGHNLGFHHAATPGVEYGDASDPMGAAKLVQSNAPNRVMAGWLGSGQVMDVGVGGTYALNALEAAPSAGAAQVLRLRKPDTNESYYLSLRQPIGVDTALWSTYQNTISIHKSTGTMPAYTFLLATLAAGQSWSDSANGITVSSLGAAGSTASVSVALGGAACVRQAPSVTLSPASQTASAGTAVGYAVAVANNNSAACPVSTFNLTQLLPAGFSGAFASSSVTLAPGTGASVAWSVASTSTSGDGVYTLTARAAESSVSNTAESHAAYTVSTPVAPPPVAPPPPPAQTADATPPVVTITSPTNGFAISGRVLGIAAQAGDNVGVSAVEFYLDGKLIATDTGAPYSANVNTRKMGKGTHSIRARALDAAGNAGEQTISVTLN